MDDSHVVAGSSKLLPLMLVNVFLVYILHVVIYDTIIYASDLAFT